MQVSTSFTIYKRDTDDNNIAGAISFQATRFVRNGEGFDNLHIVDQHSFNITEEEAHEIIKDLQKLL